MTDVSRIEIIRIAEGLTEFQRQMIVGNYNPELTGGRLSKVWRNLRKRGLAGPPYTGLTPLGKQVQDYLRSHQ